MKEILLCRIRQICGFKRIAFAFSLVEMLMALLVASLLLAALAPVMTRKMNESANILVSGGGVKSDYQRIFYEDFEWAVPAGVNVINITSVGAGGGGGGATYGYKEITSSETNWIVPEGVTKLRVFMTGAGGGGASGGRGDTWVTVNGEDTHQDFLTPGESTFSKIVPELDANCKTSGSANWISTIDNSKIYSPGSSYLNSVKVTACGGGGGSGGAEPSQGNSGGGGSGGFLSNKIVEFNATTLYIKIPHGGGAGADCGNAENALGGGYYSGGGGGGAGRTNTGGASSYQFGGHGGSGFYTLTSNETKNAYDGTNGDSYLSSLAGGGSINYGYFVLTGSDKKYEFYSGAGGNGGIWGGGGGGGGRSAYYVCGGGGGGGGGPTTISTQSGNNENSIVFQIGGGGGGGGGGSIGKSSDGVTTSYGAGGAGGAGGGYGAGGGAAGGGRQGNTLASKGASFKTTNIGGGNGKTGSQSQRQNAGAGGSGYGGGATSHCGASTIDDAIAIFGENHCSGGAGKCSSTATMSRGENGKPGALRLEYSYPAIKCQRNVPANGGAGGGAGQIWIGEIDVVPGQKINFNVGLGGNTQNVPGKNGNDGTQTSIVINGTTIASASGGKGGKYESDDTYIANSGGLGGGLKNEDFKNWTGIEGILGGQAGKPGNTVTNGAGGGAGGTTFKKDGTMINGGASAGAQSNGADAPSTNYGTGGGGGGGVIANNMIPGHGGRGANGYIYIEWGSTNGGGGSSGQIVKKNNVWVTPGTKIQITVGKGGESRPVLNTLNGVSGYFGQQGNNGGDSYITTNEGIKARAKGGVGGYPGGALHGKGGNYYEVDDNDKPIPSSNPNYIKDMIKGEDGSDDYGGAGGSITEALCPLITSLNGLGGCGGNMPNGNCANSSSTAIGKNASKIGGGGGGGAVKDNAAYQGGRGANGMVVIEWSN